MTSTVEAPAISQASADARYLKSTTDVQRVPAPTGNETTDSAAIQAAHDALPSYGGEIVLAAGAYGLSGVTFTKPVTLTGKGMGDPYAGRQGSSDTNHRNARGITSLLVSSATIDALTVVNGCTLRDFTMVNTATTPTAGSGIKVATGNSLRFQRVAVLGFYDNVSFVIQGEYWTMEDCFMYEPVRYGLWLRNTQNGDAGDGVVQGCSFVCINRLASAAIRYESGGGLKITGLKVNGRNPTGAFTTGVDLALADGVATADLLITTSSFENISGYAVRLGRVSGGTNGTMSGFLISDNEIGYQVGSSGGGISLSAGLSLGEINGNVFQYLATGILVNGSTGVNIGTNSYSSVTTPVSITTSASNSCRVGVQNRVDAGVIVADASTAIGNIVPVKYDYRRDTQFVSSGGVNFFTFVVAAYQAGILEFEFIGLASGVSGASWKGSRSYVRSGAGVAPVIATVGTDIQVGVAAAQMAISFPSATDGTVSLRLALAGGATATDIQGLLTIKIGGQLVSFSLA